MAKFAERARERSARFEISTMERKADGTRTERGEEAERDDWKRKRANERERCGIEGVKGRSLRNASRALADNANKLDDNGVP